MSVSLTDNRCQPAFGAFIIFLYALYGAYISSLYILDGDKKDWPSADFYIFVTVILLLGLTSLGQLIFQKIAKLDKKSILMLLLFIYILIRLITGNREESIIDFGTLIKDIGMNFITGFIAFSIIKSRIPVMSKLTDGTQTFKRIKRMAVTCTIIFIGLNFYFLTTFLNISMFDFFSTFKMANINNDYYQDFGDYLTIAFCCLVSLQLVYLKNSARSNTAFYVFVFAIIIQAMIAFISVQTVNSNKSALVIVLVSALAIYAAKPKDWLIKDNRFSIKEILGLAVLLIAVFIMYKYMPELDFSQLRIFDYGESSLIQNSSIQSRWELLIEQGVDQLSIAPVFGDLSIRSYIHSTLISVQTHLGIIGSLLLWSFLLPQLFHIYLHGGNEGLKAIALPIVFVAIISSFFTWGPIWFLLGALYGYTPQKLEYVNNNAT